MKAILGFRVMTGFDTLIRKRTRPIRASRTPPRIVGSLPRRPRAVLFDVYGTLLAHRKGRSRGPMSESKMLRSLVDAHRLPIDPDGLSESLGSAISEEKADLHAGRTRNTEIRIERVWKRLFPERSRGELERIALEYELAVNPVWPMPGCRRCIEYLGRLQMTLGLVSNAQFYTPLLFHALLGADPIGLGFTPGICLYSYVHGIAKPDPSLFEIAAARLSRMGIRREETLMVGNDLINDIEPAMRTGFLAVLFGGELPGSPVRPTARISRLGDLKELIEGAPRP